MLTPRQKEELRQSVLGYLAGRIPLKFEPAAISAVFRKRRPELDFAYADDDVAQTCEFLHSARLLDREVAPLGSSLHYSANSAGVLEAERNGFT